jgi:hypothetical protein
MPLAKPLRVLEMTRQSTGVLVPDFNAAFSGFNLQPIGCVSIWIDHIPILER